MEQQMNEQDHYVLIVVDMQSDQRAANDPAILAAVCREIEEAKRRQLPILVLEFPDQIQLHKIRYEAEEAGKPFPIGRTEVEHPLTLPSVMKLLEGYEHKSVRQKFDFSGAMEVFYACHDHGWPKTAFRLVGVYAFSCVLRTAEGLAEINPYADLTVVQDACGYEPRWGANWFKFDGVATVVSSQPEAA